MSVDERAPFSGSSVRAPPNQPAWNSSEQNTVSSVVPIPSQIRECVKMRELIRNFLFYLSLLCFSSPVILKIKNVIIFFFFVAAPPAMLSSLTFQSTSLQPSALFPTQTVASVLNSPSQVASSSAFNSSRKSCLNKFSLWINISIFLPDWSIRFAIL